MNRLLLAVALALSVAAVYRMNQAHVEREAELQAEVDEQAETIRHQLDETVDRIWPAIQQHKVKHYFRGRR